MGQRSQMYVITKKNDKYYMAANYYQWNYGERMLSRTRGTLENIVDCYMEHSYYLTTNSPKINNVMAVNWDMHDVLEYTDIIKEFQECYADGDAKSEDGTFAEDFYSWCFEGQDNNNGQSYIYVDLDVATDKRLPKVGFTKYTFDESKPMLSAEIYLQHDLSLVEKNCEKITWDEYMKMNFSKGYYDEETVTYTRNNIDYINNHSELISTEELNNILINVAKQFEENYLKGML